MSLDIYAHRVDSDGKMTRLLTEPVASTIVALDEADEATLTDLARASGRAVSTIQRAVDGLAKAGVVMRTSPRGPYRFTASAPRRALRELAEWGLAPGASERIVAWVRRDDAASGFHRPPSTIRNPRIREAWPRAIDRIVTMHHPRKIVLFGSQARGDGRPDSDVDLLVVLDGEGDRRSARVQILKLLADMPFAKDILVARPEDLAHPLPGTALADAVREGILVHGR